MMRCPRSLADSSNGINVVDASEFGDRGFKRFHLLVPVCHVYSIKPCDLAILVDLICECLDAFGVLVDDEDLDATMLLVLGFEEPARKWADPRPTSMVATARPMPLAPPRSYV
jgi:hypothetical protein